jgi:hypothetical protein
MQIQIKKLWIAEILNLTIEGKLSLFQIKCSMEILKSKLKCLKNLETQLELKVENLKQIKCLFHPVVKKVVQVIALTNN